MGSLLGQSQDLASASLKNINPLMQVLMSACKLLTRRNTWVVHLAFRLTKASEKGGDCKAKCRVLSQHLPSTDYCLAFHQKSFIQAGTSSGSTPSVSLAPGSSVWHKDVSKYIFVCLFFICHIFFISSTSISTCYIRFYMLVIFCFSNAREKTMCLCTFDKITHRL